MVGGPPVTRLQLAVRLPERETRHGRLSGIFSIRRAYHVRLMGVQKLSLTHGSLNWRDIILRARSLAGPLNIWQ
jgi:hypothetical protein